VAPDKVAALAAGEVAQVVLAAEVAGPEAGVVAPEPGVVGFVAWVVALVDAVVGPGG
jgi:hypothetical protein